MSDHEDDTVFPTSSDEEIYEEGDCMTDDEEEVAHDHICCKKCGKHTHVSIGKCSNDKCGYEFKFSASGYLIDGEDGGFICDGGSDSEEEIEESDEEEMEYESDEDSEDSAEIEESEDEEAMYDDEKEYVPKFAMENINTLPRRTTRSMRT